MMLGVWLLGASRCAMVLVLVACGDNLPYEPSQDGSRLRLQWYEFADGTRQVQRSAPFFDTVLGLECTRQTWRDGRDRCTPAASDLMYRDERCTIGVGASVNESPAFRVTSLADGERRVEAMWLAGEEIPTPPRLFAKLDGVCTPQPLALSTTRALRNLTSDELVPLARGALPSSGRLAPVVVEGSDGLRSTIMLEDQELGVECEIPTSLNQESGTCYPNKYAVTDAFRDPACKIPVYVERTKGARLVVVVGHWTMHWIGDPIVTPVFLRTNQACSEIDVEGARVFEVGARVELAAVRRRRVDAARRLHHYVLERENVSTWALFDTELGVDCVVGRLDGVLRCLPFAGYVERLFADAACTVPRPVTATTRSLISPDLTSHASWRLENGTTEFFDYGPEVVDTVYRERTFPTPSCEPFEPDGRLVRDLGRRIPPDVFAEATPTIRP